MCDAPSVTYLFWRYNTVALRLTKTGMATRRQSHSTECRSILADTAGLVQDSAHFDRDWLNKPGMRTGTAVFSDFWTMVLKKDTFHLILAYNLFKSQFISCYLWYSHSNSSEVCNILPLLVYFKETWLQENDISWPIKSLSIEFYSKFQDRSRTGPQSFWAERPQDRSFRKCQDRGHPNNKITKYNHDPWHQ